MVIHVFAISGDGARRIVRRLQPGAVIVDLKGLPDPPTAEALSHFWSTVKRLNQTTTGQVHRHTPGPVQPKR